jgi:hypothetical protein
VHSNHFASRSDVNVGERAGGTKAGIIDHPLQRWELAYFPTQLIDGGNLSEVAPYGFDGYTEALPDRCGDFVETGLASPGDEKVMSTLAEEGGIRRT